MAHKKRCEESNEQPTRQPAGNPCRGWPISPAYIVIGPIWLWPFIVIAYTGMACIVMAHVVIAEAC